MERFYGVVSGVRAELKKLDAKLVTLRELNAQAGLAAAGIASAKAARDELSAEVLLAFYRELVTMPILLRLSESSVKARASRILGKKQRRATGSAPAATRITRRRTSVACPDGLRVQ